ncbi:MAG: tetratricopeptide repeat protein [Pseudomonadota bacterium]
MTDQPKTDTESHLLAFDQHVIDRERVEVRRDGVLLDMPARSVGLLLLLIDADNAVVDKDDLVARLWPDQDVSDWSLSRLVSDTRQMLGDNAQVQRYIQTVRNRGFRWNPAVTVEDCAEPPDTVAPVSRAGRLRYRRLVVLTLALLSTIGVVFAVRPYLFPEPVGSVRAVVLPLVVETGDDRDAWAEYGVMSLLTTELQRFNGLQVQDVSATVSGLSQISFERQDAAAAMFDRVCDAFGCSHLIDSRLVVDDNGETAIDFRVITATESGQYRRIEGGDILQSAGRASRELVTSIVPVRPERPALQSMYVEDRVANQNFALGVNAVLARRFEAAEQYLTLALKAQPDYRWAELYLADVYAHTARFDEAVALLDSTPADDLAMRAFTAKVRSNVAHEQGNLALAVSLADEMREIALEAGDEVGAATALMNSAATLQSLGQNAEALQRYTAAAKVFEASGHRLRAAQNSFNIGNAYYAQGDLDAALARYRDASVAFRSQGADTFLSYVDYALCAVLKTQGKYSEATPCFEQVRELSNKLGDVEGGLLVTAELSGIEMARGRLEQGVTLARQAYDGASDYAYARSYASAMLALGLLSIGDVDNATPLIQERLDNEWSDPRQPYVLISASAAHAVGELASAVQIAEAVRADIGDAWTPEHQAWLDWFARDAAAGERTIPNYYALDSADR